MRIEIASKYFYEQNMSELEEYVQEKRDNVISTLGEIPEFEGVDTVMEEDECLHVYVHIADNAAPETVFEIGRLIGWDQRHGSL